MPVIIDGLTICLAAAVVSVTFGAAYAVLWARHGRSAHLLCWSGAGLTYGIGVIGFLFSDHPLPVVLAVALYAMLTGAVAMILAGVSAFEGTSIQRLPAVLITLPAPLAFAAATMLGGPWPANVWSALGVSLSVLLGGWWLIRVPPHGHAMWRRAVGWALIGFLPSHALSIMDDLAINPFTAGLTGWAYLSHLPLLLTIHVGLLAMPGERAIARLRACSYRDALTGLRNRAWLIDHGDAWARMATGVAMVDVDHFKQINDGHGHDTGDAVLATIGQRLGALARALGGEAIRLGGDEFLMLLPDHGVSLPAITAAMAEPCAGNSELPGWSVSIGTARWRPGEPSLRAAMTRADRLLYAAKRARPLARAA